MSFQRPTLTELIGRGQDDLNARLPGADSRLRRSVLGVIVTVVMGAINQLYGYIDYLSRQVLPDTADAEYLGRHASSFSVIRKAATVANGDVVATGVNGAVIPAATVLQRADGQTFVTLSAATIVAGQAILSVAAEKAGAAGVTAAGARMTLVSPIAGVTASAVVAAGGLTGGANEESDDLLRGRLLERMRAAPEGGALHDYVRWMKEVTEVTRAWVYPGWMGAGTVGLAFVMDGRVDPIPTTDDVDVVEAYVAAVAPVTAELVVFAPIAQALNLVISGLTPDDPAVEAAIRAEVSDLLFREAQPGGTILLSHLREAISTAAGEQDHVLTSPVANVVLAPGRLAVLGTVTFP